MVYFVNLPTATPSFGTALAKIAEIKEINSDITSLNRLLQQGQIIKTNRPFFSSESGVDVPSIDEAASCEIDLSIQGRPYTLTFDPTGATFRLERHRHDKTFQRSPYFLSYGESQVSSLVHTTDNPNTLKAARQFLINLLTEIGHANLIKIDANH